MLLQGGVAFPRLHGDHRTIGWARINQDYWVNWVEVLTQFTKLPLGYRSKSSINNLTRKIGKVIEVGYVAEEWNRIPYRPGSSVEPLACMYHLGKMNTTHEETQPATELQHHWRAHQTVSSCPTHTLEARPPPHCSKTTPPWITIRLPVEKNNYYFLGLKIIVVRL